MNRTTFALVTSVALAAVACDEKKQETTAPAPTTESAPIEVTIAETDLSTPADFEEQAEQAITKTNYKDALASLETDISKE